MVGGGMGLTWFGAEGHDGGVPEWSLGGEWSVVVRWWNIW